MQAAIQGMQGIREEYESIAATPVGYQQAH
jgi:hypothetical protein